MKIINTGSPYYITKTGLENDELLQVNIHLNSSSNMIPAHLLSPDDADFTLRATPINGECSIDVSEYVKPEQNSGDPSVVKVKYASIDWGEHNIDTGLFTSSDNERYVGTSGYSYFEEGQIELSTTAQGYDDGLQYYGKVFNGDVFFRKDSGHLKIPIIPALSGGVIVRNSGDNVVHTYNFTGNYTETNFFQTIDTSVDIADDREIYSLEFFNNDGEFTPVSIESIESSCEFTSKTLRFMNKFGGMQDMFFNARSDSKLNVKKKNFTSSLGVGYSNQSHAINTYQMDSKVSDTLNSDYYPSDANHLFDELLMSKRVFLIDGIISKPVVVKTSSHERLSSENGDLIQYTIEVEDANDKINRQ